MFSRSKLKLMSSLFLSILCMPSMQGFTTVSEWQLGPFARIDEANPLMQKSRASTFVCPLQNKEVFWEGDHIFNPGAIVREGKVYLFYRAEDDFGCGIGQHTSRLGLALSSDGIHFQKHGVPILFPDHDEQTTFEWPGGCEDPRVVQTDEGTYVMTYTQWNRNSAVLAIATSNDLLHWKKHGYAFRDNFERTWSKSGSIVCRREGDYLIAAKINGKYWMYWGEGHIYAATSEDLISWVPVLDKEGSPKAVLDPRPGKFDSMLVESGPPAIVTDKGILLLYNGKNSSDKGDPFITANAYSAGQVLFDSNEPTRMIDRSENCFLSPEREYEMNGQYSGGTVFIQGLIHYKERWHLYYGMADSAIGVAVTK